MAVFLCIAESAEKFTKLAHGRYLNDQEVKSFAQKWSLAIKDTRKSHSYKHNEESNPERKKHETGRKKKNKSTTEVNNSA